MAASDSEAGPDAVQPSRVQHPAASCCQALRCETNQLTCSWDLPHLRGFLFTECPSRSPPDSWKLGLDPRALPCQSTSAGLLAPEATSTQCSSQTLCLADALHTGWGLTDPNKLSMDLRREAFLDKPPRGVQNVAYSSFPKRDMKVGTYVGLPPPTLPLLQG